MISLFLVYSAIFAAIAAGGPVIPNPNNVLPRDPTSTVSAPSMTVSTSIPSSSSSPDSLLPSQVPLPPKQSWCPSKIFCAGSLLQTVGVAKLYADDKTFVDKPTSKNAQSVLTDFQNISRTDIKYKDIINFVETDFSGEGLELMAIPLPGYNPNPSFLNQLSSDNLLQTWAKTVHSYWTQLARSTNTTTLCGHGRDCESSLIPLNHTFVVPGGRFREQYYWDSYWILEGLIESELYEIAGETLENFMNELQDFGFIPNGGRIYYLNRSQPPVFIQMLHRFVTATNITSILQRALPLAEKELKWWEENRSIDVTSPYTKKTHKMYHYAVKNTAPRPESYLQDYKTANDPDDLNTDQKAELYAELASGAESGWDYTVRWFGTNTNATTHLRNLQVRKTIPVDLNSILYRDHKLMTELYKLNGTSGAPPEAANSHEEAAEALKEGILDLFWESKKLAFYDFNLNLNDKNTIFTAANFYPYWSGIIPNEVLTVPESAFKAFSSLNLVMNRYNGTFPTTFIESGNQWDAPNAWPPHQYIILKAINALPHNVSHFAVPSTTNSDQSTFSLIPIGQLGLAEQDLPRQPLSGSATAPVSGSKADINAMNGTVFNGGHAIDGEGWAAALQRELANRYFASAFCSWYATGGSLPGLLPPHNATSPSTGNMFEKFSAFDIDSAGRGGEYSVQVGFGWTNGVVLWVASNYGNVLARPQCPDPSQNPFVTGTAKSFRQVV